MQIANSGSNSHSTVKWDSSMWVFEKLIPLTPYYEKVKEDEQICSSFYCALFYLKQEQLSYDFEFCMVEYGTGSYEVLLFPKKDSVMNYKLKGSIDQESEYYLTQLNFPNGGYVTFDGEYGVSPLEFNKIVELEDDNGEIRYIELTKNKIGANEIWLRSILYYLYFFMGLCCLGITQILKIFSSDEDDSNSRWAKFEDSIYRHPKVTLTILWIIRGMGSILLVYLLLSK